MKGLMAKDVMRTEVHAVGEETPLLAIATLLATHHISGVPVIDEGQRLIGIVTEADLIDEHKRERHIPRVALYGIFPIPEDLLEETYESGKGLTARAVMTRKVTAASEQTSLHELADMMVMRHINRVPIVRDGKLVGIVGRGDLVRALADESGA
jgi:CBS domain-containing protein